MTPPSKTNVEPGSWWPIVAGFSGALGALAFLAVHLALEATDARAWMWVWMVVPIALWGASGLALAIAAGADLRSWLRVLPAALLGYSPPANSTRRGYMRRPHPQTRAQRPPTRRDSRAYGALRPRRDHSPASVD
jgi:hypothetical protein